MPVELAEIKNFYETAFQNYNGKYDIKEINVEYYSYIGINHTIRLRNAKIFVRISDIFKDAPPEVHDALAKILVSKILKRKVPLAANEIYNEYASKQEIRAQAFENKRQKGRKIITSAKGEIYDLEEIFRQMNDLYFDNQIKKPTLTWSARTTFRRLGHHDAAHDTIVISKSLDDKKVPRYVVEFVVFHEMLHIFHPMKLQNGRRYHHTPAFRRDEKKFAFYEKSENWIENNSRFLKRKARF
jgi:predicted metal-dependent hydrolase